MATREPSKSSENAHCNILSEDLLVEIFCRVYIYEPVLSEGTPARQLSSLPQVCRKWAAAYAKPSLLWQDLQINLPAGYSVGQWLQDRVPAVQSLRVQGPELGPREQLYDGPANRAAHRRTIASKALHGLGKVLSELSKPSTVLPGTSMGAGLEKLVLQHTRLPKQSVSSLASISTLVSLSSLTIAEDYTRDFWRYDLLTEAQRSTLWDGMTTLGDTLTQLSLSGLAVRNPDEEGRLLRLPVPDNFTALSRLRSLKLDNNGFHCFPKTLGQLLVQTLCIGDEWSSLSAIGDLGYLKDLEILAHFFIPNDLQCVRNLGLQSLRIVLWNETYRANSFLDDMAICKLLLLGPLELTSLSLRDINLTEVPKPIWHMSRLQHLDLHANAVECLPIGEYLANLSYLDLSNTYMVDIPEVLPGLTGLQHLDLSGTGIPDFPKGNYEASLTWLSLASTNIEDIPESIQQMKHLRHLDLSKTDITNMPIGTYLSGLTMLNIYGTRRMTHVPEAVTCAREVEELHVTLSGPNMSLTDIRLMRALPKLSRVHFVLTYADGSKSGEHDFSGRFLVMHMLTRLEKSISEGTFSR